MEKISIGYFVIASAIIWGAVIVGSSFALSGTPFKEEVSFIIGGGAVFHLLFIWGPLAAQFGKNKKENPK